MGGKTMTGRDKRGRFISGHPWASSGGKARARALDPERRRAIARAGWRGLVARRFDGDSQRAREWLGELGAFASDAGYRAVGLGVFRDPGPCPGGEA